MHQADGLFFLAGGGVLVIFETLEQGGRAIAYPDDSQPNLRHVPLLPAAVHEVRGPTHPRAYASTGIKSAASLMFLTEPGGKVNCPAIAYAQRQPYRHPVSEATQTYPKLLKCPARKTAASLT